MNNLPQWVRDGSKPTVPGLYERLYDESTGNPSTYECEWDGEFWYYGTKDVQARGTPSAFQNRPWRDHNNIQSNKETTPMTKTIDFTKPVQTRDGRPARVLCTDKKGETRYPVWALVLQGDEEVSHSYTLDGHYFHDGSTSAHDIVNVPVRTENFINFYGQGYSAYVYKTLADANKAASLHRVGVLKVVMEDGKAVSSELVAQ